MVSAADAMRFRRLARGVHLALGLVVGGFFVVASLTGALLVFAPELEQAAVGEPYRATPGRDVGFQATLDRVAEAYPGRRIAMLWWPTYRSVYTALLAGDGAEPELHVHVDPGTGEITGTSSGGGSFFGWVTTLHTSLLAGEFGVTLVSFATIGAVVLLVSGLFLWWPGARRLASAFAVRRHKGGFLLTFDLHRVIGALASVPLLIMATTGLVMAFPDTTGRIIHGLVPGSGSPEPTWQAPLPRPSVGVLSSPARRIAPAECLRIAHEQVPGAETFYLTFPEEPTDPIQVRLRVGEEPRPFGITCRVFLDPSSGEILRVMDPRRMGAANRYITHNNYPLHVGSIGGVPMRLAYVAAALSPAALMITGLSIWRQKRSKRRRPGRPRGRPAGIPTKRNETDHAEHLH